MQVFKSHFWYTKRQRNGIVILILLILGFQCVYWFADFSSESTVDLRSEELLDFQKQLDSLRVAALSEKRPRIYPFNPNYITDFKGYQLGMSVGEIDRLLAFRKRGKYINSVKEFKSVTQINDSVLLKISPFFKFPKWTNNSQGLKERKVYKNSSSYRRSKKQISTNDLNTATQEDFQTINGIGETFSKRIVNYRRKLQGFSDVGQLYEVWGLNREVADRVLDIFSIVEKPVLQKINVNTASFKEVLKHPYIDYDLCKKIFDYRDEVAELQEISELKKIQGFPLNKYERIILYLEAK